MAGEALLQHMDQNPVLEYLLIEDTYSRLKRTLEIADELFRGMDHLKRDQVWYYVRHINKDATASMFSELLHQHISQIDVNHALSVLALREPEGYLIDMYAFISRETSRGFELGRDGWGFEFGRDGWGFELGRDEDEEGEDDPQEDQIVWWKKGLAGAIVILGVSLLAKKLIRASASS